MGTDDTSWTRFPALEKIYMDSCERHGVAPNFAIRSGFIKAKARLSFNELCVLEICLDDLKDTDIPPLVDVCHAIEASEIEAIDIFNGRSHALTAECALSLLRAFTQKLRVVDLCGSSFGNDFWRDLSWRGLACQVLNMRSSRIRKLNMAGKFEQLHTLNLDFSASLTSFQEDCFTCMPNLVFLSMCETKVANLFTTTAALSKLTGLLELRFQKWVSCSDDGSASSSSSGGTLYEPLGHGLSNRRTSFRYSRNFDFETEVVHGALMRSTTHEDENTMEDSSDDSNAEWSSHHEEYTQLLSDVSSRWNTQFNLLGEASSGMFYLNQDSLSGASTEDIAENTKTKPQYLPYHPSPICFEKHYREYVIVSLPQLKVLDNLEINNSERDESAVTFSQHFEYLPYKWNHKESVVSILNSREIKGRRSHPWTKHQKPSQSNWTSKYYYTRALCAAKVGSSAWPLLHPLSLLPCELWNGSRSYRPRQFEYHPSNASLMVFGTLDGELVVVNHENGKMVGFVPSFGAMSSVLGLCWLNNHPSKLIAGSDNGTLKLFDIDHLRQTARGIHSSSRAIAFDEFDQLTSVHVNCTDAQFLASGYSKNVALYDVNLGKRIQMFTDLHRQHINVVKFSHRCPHIFATSSFDGDVKTWDLRMGTRWPCYTVSSRKGNVMVCFAPDDYYLLVSAVDNEVRQLLTVDGRDHLTFEIPPTGSSQNFTRSYYMNGRDYIISGSCDENVVRVCCARTGRRLREVSLSGRSMKSSMYVQSLRGDPFRPFNMSVLAAYMRPSTKSEIIKVNLLASASDRDNDHSRSPDSIPSSSIMGG